MPDWFDEGRASSAVDVPALFDSEATLGALWDMVGAGALVSVGRTRDGGAVGVTVTVDGRWRREYFRDGDELQGWLSEALPAVLDAVEAAASSARGQRARRERRL